MQEFLLKKAMASGTGIFSSSLRQENTDELDAYEQQLLDTYQDLVTSLNVLWLIIATALVWYMQAGFTMLEAGTVRVKNVKHIILKNISDGFVSVLVFWAVGYSFAYGRSSDNEANPFIGETDFFLEGYSGPLAFVVFQMGFASTSVTIVSGAIAERTQYPIYFVYSIFVSGFVYPVVVHWVWTEEGFLKSLDVSSNGCLDFAGGLPVHTIGGVTALIGAYFVGPRIGRFGDDGYPRDLPGYSINLVVLGVLILWFGWFGFNGGSGLIISDGGLIASRAIINTGLAGASGCIFFLIFDRAYQGYYDLTGILNGVLSGLVSITAPCAFVSPMGSVIIAAIGALLYKGGSRAVLKLQIDDSIDAFAVHGVCGLWGVISVGFFATEEALANIFGNNIEDYGLLYGGGWNQLGAQLIGCVVVVCWVSFWGILLFAFAKKFHLLRVEEEEEVHGVDARGFGPCTWARIEAFENGYYDEYQFRIE